MTAALVLFGGVGQAKAGMLYSQPLTASPTLNFGFNSDGPNSGSGDPQEVADNFTLSASAQLQQIQWDGIFHDGSVPAGPTQFRVFIYQDSGGTPGSTCFTESDDVLGVNTGLANSAGDPILAYSLSLAHPVNLPGGQQFWLSILSDDFSISSIWAWQVSDVGDKHVASRQGHSGGWSVIPIRVDTAFTLNGVPTATAAPEPASLTMLALGLAGLAAYGRSSRKLAAA
jgi:hypothetical protein